MNRQTGTNLYERPNQASRSLLNIRANTQRFLEPIQLLARLKGNVAEVTETYAEALKFVCSKCKHVIPNPSRDTVLVRLCSDGVHRMFCEACAE